MVFTTRTLSKSIMIYVQVGFAFIVLGIHKLLENRIH